MDNNTPKGDNEKKPFNKKYNHHRRRNQSSSQTEVADASPNGQVIVRGGRYDLPPSAEDGVSVKPEIQAAKTARPERSADSEAHKPAQSASDADRIDGASDERENRRSRRPRPNHSRKNDQSESNRKPEVSDLIAEDEAAASDENVGEKGGDTKKSRRQRGVRRKNHRANQPSSDKDTPELDELAIDDVGYGDNTEADTADLNASDISDTRPITAENSSEITLTANAAPGSPTDGEIIEELNSTENPADAPGIEKPQSTEGENSASDTSEAEPEPPLATFEIIGVKFKATGKIYYFDPCGYRFRRGDAIVVDTARGLEFGSVELGNRMVTEREVVLPLRRVVRRATDDDIARNEANAARAAEALVICAEKIAEHKLDMKLVDVEYTFDNSKLLFYFTSDGRVDFRELVKDLASVFRTRIELRQIGIRDETKLLGGIGICGRPFCCKTFLSDFVQVSIKMAKEQSLSLNSAKISGACGRLMCCLRYEYDTYAEEIRKTPKVDQIVSTPDGEGLVIEVQPLAGLVRVRFQGSDNPPKVFHRDDVTVIGGKGVKNKPQGNANMN